MFFTSILFFTYKLKFEDEGDTTVAEIIFLYP